MILPNAPRAKSSLWENSHAFPGEKTRFGKSPNLFLLHFCGRLCCSAVQKKRRGIKAFCPASPAGVRPRTAALRVWLQRCYCMSNTSVRLIFFAFDVSASTLTYIFPDVYLAVLIWYCPSTPVVATDS